MRSSCSFATQRRRDAASGQTAMGPFYCPVDQKIYIDLSFYDELRTRFGAPGDFAEAYVITHELGHHVQHLLGTDAKVASRAAAEPAIRRTRCRWRSSFRPTATPACGRTIRRSENILEPGDIDEGAERGGRGWRRSNSETDDGARERRIVHARLVATAGDVVPARVYVGQSGVVQHVRGCVRA